MFLRQVRLVPYAGYGLGRRLGQRMPCWRTQDGGTLCADRHYYLPG